MTQRLPNSTARHLGGRQAARTAFQQARPMGLRTTASPERRAWEQACVERVEAEIARRSADGEYLTSMDRGALLRAELAKGMPR